MGSGIFEGAIQSLLIVGIIVGIVLCGLAALAYWLFMHVTLGWV